MSYDPSWVEVLQLAVQSGLAEVRTSAPGKVKTYDPATQTATVQVMVYDGEKPVPPLEGVKVRFPRFGAFRLVGPIAVDQAVTVNFFELDPARWEATGELSKPDIERRHGLFATCTPDLFSDSEVWGDLADGLLRLGTQDAVTEITIDGSGIVRIGNHSATDFVALASLVADELERIKTELLTLKSATAAVAVAVDAVAPGTSGAFNTAASSVGGDPGDVAATKVKAV